MRRRFVTTNAWALRAKAGILLDTPDRTDELVALAADGLAVAVVYGPLDDAWTTAVQDRVAAALGTTAVVVPGTGHSPAAEDPQAAAEVLDRVLSGFAAVAAG
jgi:pimeloyl-ACP methyl ester carboxylesterase